MRKKTDDSQARFLAKIEQMWMDKTSRQVELLITSLFDNRLASPFVYWFAGQINPRSPGKAGLFGFRHYPNHVIAQSFYG